MKAVGARIKHKTVVVKSNPIPSNPLAGLIYGKRKFVLPCIIGHGQA